MKKRSTNRNRRPEAGIALLISIFVLLLISVIAIALIVSSGTESALAGNYRSSTGVYYAALSGIEEARGRLLSSNPAAFKTTDPTTFLPTPGTPLIIGDTYYLINPVGGETITPWVSGSTYEDKQFGVEFGPSGFGAPANPSKTALSVWNRNPLQSLNLPGPLYKWVRINAVSEKSLGVDADADGLPDKTTPLYYNGSQFSNSPTAGPQVIELTAFAILPNGSQKILQYIAAPALVPLPSFLSSAPLAALTLSGSQDPGGSPAFHAPNTNSVYAVTGIDSLQGCSGGTGASVAAIGLFGDYSSGSYASDLTNLVNGIPTSASTPPPTTNPQQNYTGNTPPHSLPDVEYLSTYPTSLQTPAQVDAIAQNIIQNADAVFVPAGSASTQTAFLTSLGMSATNPMTVIANGNLDVSNWSHDGYGLLLVTGTFTYDPDTRWYGLVLVIGQGVINNSQNGQYKQTNGAVFVAKTRDSSGSLRTGRIGGASVSFLDAMQGDGIRYSSCWVQRAQPTSNYKILSFHEISQ